MNQEKAEVNIIIIGNVHSGKSILIEKLFYMYGGIDKRTREKYEKEAAAVSSPLYLYQFYSVQ